MIIPIALLMKVIADDNGIREIASKIVNKSP